MWNVVSNGFIFQCQFPQLLTCHTLSGWVKICFTPSNFFWFQTKNLPRNKAWRSRSEVGKREVWKFPSFLIRSCWKTHGQNSMTFHAEIFYRSASQVLIVATDFEEDLWEENFPGPKKNSQLILASLSWISLFDDFDTPKLCWGLLLVKEPWWTVWFLSRPSQKWSFVGLFAFAVFNRKVRNCHFEFG